MRSIWIPKFGAPDVLEVRETPDPTPGPGEVRVDVKASGLNFAEVMGRQGLYPDAPKPPMVMGYEVAGTIDAVGEGVDASRIGDRVAAMVRFGGHASKCVVGERQVFDMPEAMTFEEGAALPVNYITAYHMLFQVHRLRAGDHVLIHMAAGGVGTAALQLCRTVDGVTTYGTASAKKHDYARSHGCDHPIDYRSEDYVAAVRALIGERGLELVVDPLGGADWKKGMSLLRASGLLIAFGWANMSVGNKRSLTRVASEFVKQPVVTAPGLMDQNRGIAGVNMGHMWHEVDMIREQGTSLMRLYEEGAIKPHVDAVYSFDQAAEAHAYLEGGKNVGKVVLVP